MARQPRHAAARMRARPAQVEPLDGRAVVGVPQHGARAPDLVERQSAVKDVATDEPVLTLHVARRQYLAAQPRRLEVGGVPRHGAHYHVRGRLAYIVPVELTGQVIGEMLAEQARHVLAGWRERGVDRGRDYHLDDGRARAAIGARVAVGLPLAREPGPDYDA